MTCFFRIAVPMCCTRIKDFGKAFLYINRSCQFYRKVSFNILNVLSSRFEYVLTLVVLWKKKVIKKTNLVELRSFCSCVLIVVHHMTSLIQWKDQELVGGEIRWALYHLHDFSYQKQTAKQQISLITQFTYMSIYEL